MQIVFSCRQKSNTKRVDLVRCTTVNGRTREKANVGWYCILYSFKFRSQYNHDLCQLFYLANRVKQRNSLSELRLHVPTNCLSQVSNLVQVFRKVKLYAHYYQITPLYPLYLGERLLKVAIVSGRKLLKLKLSKARRQNEGESNLRTEAGTSALCLLLFKEKIPLCRTFDFRNYIRSHL